MGTYGDGGMIVTNDADLADILRLLRNHGSNGNYQHERIGWNSRLDEIQCSILNVKSKYLDSWNLKRNEIALRYNYRLRDTPVVTPIVSENCKHVYNQYVIKAKDRDNLSKTLEQNEIETRIYYPEPVNLASPYNHDLAFSPNSSDAYDLLVRLAGTVLQNSRVLAVNCFQHLLALRRFGATSDLRNQTRYVVDLARLRVRFA